jgi:hypothetical protein
MARRVRTGREGAHVCITGHPSAYTIHVEWASRANLRALCSDIETVRRCGRRVAIPAR